MRIALRKLNNFIYLLILSSVLSFFSDTSASANNYKDFNRNVKNYNKNLLIFDKSGNEIAKYVVAVANNKEKVSYGLMNLPKLDNEKGMLFLFKKDAIINMWMKNTMIPLDMIFINNDKIVSIYSGAKPYDLSVISSVFEVDKVLEVNAGQVNRNGIKTGHIISFK
jgi:uncharacterized protein